MKKKELQTSGEGARTTRSRRPVPPGWILVKYYLKPRRLSILQFAHDVGLTRKHVSGIVNDRASISPETAVRFAVVLGTTAQYWLNLQNAVDLYDASKKLSRWKPKALHGVAALSE